jgi:hypothetical protein
MYAGAIILIPEWVLRHGSEENDRIVFRLDTVKD